MPPNVTTTRDRMQALRRLLEEGGASTQDELRSNLEKQGFEVTQSTISRSLRKLSAIKATDESGRTVYRLPSDEPALPPPAQAALGDLVISIENNGALIVIQTSPGSASLVARHLDHARPGGILGTIAGDDTIFVAPKSLSEIQKTQAEIRESLL
jgi:transcriptional regulator of arginine metabolism